MTTMDSDLESQDSDEGRRFRFEATRKDETASLHSQKRRLSPSRTNLRRRSRSLNRDNRDRRASDRSRREHKKDSQSSSDVNSSSKDHDMKHSKDNNDSTRSSFRYRDSKDSKDLLNHKKSKGFRKSSFKKSRQQSRLREHDKRRSHEHSAGRNYDEKLSEKYTNRFRDRNKRQSRERSRDRSHQASSTKKTHLGRSCDEGNKIESPRKIPRRDNNDRNVEDAEKNFEKTIIISKSDPNSRSSSPSSKQECKDLNLSDFDIVSDTEEDSSDNSGSRQGSNESMSKRAENVLPYEHESNIKKRISRQQYERLLKRQVVKKHYDLEELYKVQAKNGSQLLGRSNNNRSAVSNFLLGVSVTTSTVPKLFANMMDKSIKCRKEISTSHDTDKQSMKTGLDNSNCPTHNPALPPKATDSWYVLHDEINKNDEEEEENSPPTENEKMPIAPRISGPTLPAHLRQPVEDSEMDMEDTFGPALPPHLALQTVVDENSEDEAICPILPGYDTNKRESLKKILPGSEAEDDEVIGPLPFDHPAFETDLVQQQLECRARRLKAELAVCDTEDEKQREEWMIELPPTQSVNLRLGPRKFRVRPAPDMSDRSWWTDTPADRARKQMEKLERKNIVHESTMCAERDAGNAPTEPDKSKKRPKSLLKIHQKKLQKKKKEDEKEAKKIRKTIERRPFDRDVDLQANHFDEARKKSMFLKARELDDRFSRGKL